MISDRASTILKLQSLAHSALDELIPLGAKVALIDYPNNSNVGDSLIWLGEVEYLKRRKVEIIYTCDVDNFDHDVLKNESEKNQIIILLHGGGNFGTIWPKLQAFRLRIITAFPGIKIVQLPQSIHFHSGDSVTSTAAAINAHVDFSLLVRDEKSLQFARSNFRCNVKMCPDMAFFIGALENDSKPKYQYFLLGRTDVESSGGWVDSVIAGLKSKSVNVDDWLIESALERILCRIERYTVSIRSMLDPRNRVLIYFWNLLCLVRMRRGQSLISRGEIVITDRLHTHIICILSNKPHIIVDNSYGKLSGYYNAWTRSCSYSKLTLNVEAVPKACREFDFKSKYFKGQT